MKNTYISKGKLGEVPAKLFRCNTVDYVVKNENYGRGETSVGGRVKTMKRSILALAMRKIACTEEKH